MHQAYILCQAKSGLSNSDLLAIQYGTSLVEASSVKKQVEAGADHIHLRLLRGKRKELGFFDTFFGTMSTEALRRYFN